MGKYQIFEQTKISENAIGNVMKIYLGDTKLLLGVIKYMMIKLPITM